MPRPVLSAEQQVVRHSTQLIPIISQSEQQVTLEALLNGLLAIPLLIDL